MYRTAPQVPDPADLQQCLATLPHSSALLALAAPSSFSLRQFTGWDPPPSLPTPLVGPSVGFQHSHLSLSVCLPPAFYPTCPSIIPDIVFHVVYYLQRRNVLWLRADVAEAKIQSTVSFISDRGREERRHSTCAALQLSFLVNWYICRRAPRMYFLCFCLQQAMLMFSIAPLPAHTYNLLCPDHLSFFLKKHPWREIPKLAPSLPVHPRTYLSTRAHMNSSVNTHT